MEYFVKLHLMSPSCSRRVLTQIIHGYIVSTVYSNRSPLSRLWRAGLRVKLKQAGSIILGAPMKVYICGGCYANNRAGQLIEH